MADGAWVATTDDITERERLLEQLAENHNLLTERTALFQAVIDNFPGGIAFFDPELRAVLFNDQAKRILGLPENFFRGAPPRLVDMLRFHAERGEYGPGDVEQHVAAKLAIYERRAPFSYERSGRDGSVIEVRGEPLERGGFIVTFIDITERYQAEAKIAHLASHDALTDLPNRMRFRERLDEALSAFHNGDAKVAVLMLDLNRFKQVNDTLGHPAGDALLKEVAQRLAGAVRAEDTVARLGGDEFAIVVHTFDPASEATAIAERIQNALAQPFDLGEHQAQIGTSIGIAVASAGSANADLLIKQADMALYFAKAESGDRYHFFEPQMDLPRQGLRQRRQVTAA
jgi:diguanylate cyclase (GGDEF)-like protein/PAS domain S-box-containing protein